MMCFLLSTSFTPSANETWRIEMELMPVAAFPSGAGEKYTATGLDSEFFTMLMVSSSLDEMMMSQGFSSLIFVEYGLFYATFG